MITKKLKSFNNKKRKNKIHYIFNKRFYFLKNIFSKIKNLIIWFPIIWKLRYSHYIYLIHIILFYLENMAKFFESDNTFSVDIENDAKRIKTVINLMKNVYDEKYAYEYQKEIENLYGKQKFEFVPLKDNNDLYELITVFPNKNYSEKELEKIHEHETKLLKKSLEKQNKAHRILWKLIEHNIRKWWD